MNILSSEKHSLNKEVQAENEKEHAAHALLSQSLSLFQFHSPYSHTNSLSLSFAVHSHNSFPHHTHSLYSFSLSLTCAHTHSRTLFFTTEHITCLETESATNSALTAQADFRLLRHKTWHPFDENLNHFYLKDVVSRWHRLSRCRLLLHPSDK